MDEGDRKRMKTIASSSLHFTLGPSSWPGRFSGCCTSQDTEVPSISDLLNRNLCSNVKIRTAIQLTSHFFSLKIKDLHEGTGSKTSTPSLSKGKRLRLPCLMVCPINLEIPLTFVSGEERLWVTVSRCSYSGLPNFLFPCFRACEGNGLGLQLRALDLHRAHSYFLNCRT